MNKILLLLLMISTFQVTYALDDIDGDGIYDTEYNANYNHTLTKIIDNEPNTNSENIQYICTVENVEDGEYDCLQLNTIGKFSQDKKDALETGNIDSDGDDIYDNNYTVIIDGDEVIIKDNEPETVPANIPYICTVNNVEERVYDCTINSKIGKFSQDKKDALVYGGDTDGDGVLDDDDNEKTEFNSSYANIPELMSSVKPIFLNLIPVSISKITKHSEYVTEINGDLISVSSVADSYEQANGGYYRNFDLEDVSIFDEGRLVDFVCTTQDTSTWTTNDCITSDDNYPVSTDSACCNSTANLGKFSWSKFYKSFGYNYKDSDGDGVADSSDSCEDTEDGATDVDENGCSATNKDSDGDGILDGDDKCPNTKFTQINSVSPSGEMAGCYRKCIERDDDQQTGSTWDKVRGKGEVNENLGNCSKWVECIQSQEGRCIKVDEDDEWFKDIPNTTDQGDNIEGLTKKGQTGGRNTPLKDMIKDDTDFFKTRIGGTQGAYNMSIKIAYSLKNLFLVLATIYLLILVFKVFFTSGSDEEVGKFKKGIVWTTVGMIVMQTSYAFTKSLYDKNVTEGLAYDFGITIIQPFIDLILLFVSFAFLGIAIYSFYKIVTAGGDEEGIKKGKQTILQAVMGFVVIKFTSFIVDSTYGKVECTSGGDDGSFIQTTGRNCIQEAELEGNMEIIVMIINWANSFLAIIITILIIYAGVNIMLSGGDEEKMKKAKQSIMYIAIGLVILTSSYLILSFFIIPEAQF